jgi:uncharacterized repeat protein (TIGR01451 family)
MNARMAVFALALALAGAVSAQNFTLTLQPSAVTLIPNQNASFVVSMTALNGFTSQVALAVETLPFGVTAQFSPAALTPPGTSILTLSAATNAALGSFTLNISASGGGITNTTSSSVTVNFGLLPLCTGAFRGDVTDIQTGSNVPGATVEAVYSYYNYATADASGMYIFTNLPLVAPDNQPANYSLWASRTDYWQSATITAYAVCDATNTVNLQVLRKQTGSISGQVVVQGGGPLSGVVVTVNGAEYLSVTTDTNGSFQFPVLQLNQGNVPAYYSVSAYPSGYWQSTTNTTVQANSNSVVTLILVPICTGTVTGRVIFADTGLPATNVYATVYAGGYYHSALTDSNGNYTATNVSLAFDNAPANTSVSASYTGYYQNSTNGPVLSVCGQTLTMPTLALQPVPPPPANNYGVAAGHVYDIQTGLPITNATLYLYSYNVGYSYYGTTDTNGAYYMTNILVGTGNTTNGSGLVTASASAYFSASSNLTLYANEVVTQDVRLLLIGYGAVAGTVRDSATTLPIPGAYVYPFGYSDTNGHYASGRLQLSSGNVPTYESFYASASGYWTTPYTNTTITQGNTNIVDINMVKVCSGATIVGNVVDALTQKPITNATVTVSGQVYRSDMTDTNGNFILTNITVGNDNSPIQNTLTASAPGYNPQSKTVTIFCNATITTEFGVPQTVFGGIDGYVTNAITGLPLTNVFVGTGFGAATYTDTNGYYSFSQVPLGANGASREWAVTATPSGFQQKTESVSVISNAVSRLNFGFGQPPTALIVTATGAPDPVTVGSNLLYLVTLTNTVADAQQVQLSDTLPPGVTFVSAGFTNSPGTPFSAPVYSNNVVTTTASDFGSNSAVALAIVVTPTVPGTITDIATVSSSTTDLDVTGSNHTATVTTTVVGPTAADLALIMTENSNSIVLGSNLSYMLVVTNLGPADAPDVVLDDTLPAGSVYVSSTTSQGSYTPNGGSVHWDFGALSSHGFATATLVVTPSSVGTINNSGTVTLVPGESSVVDPNPDNNTTSVVATVTAPVVTTLTNLTVLPPGNIVFNPQTGLYQQSVACTNLSGGPVTAVRVTVRGLPSWVVLYNKTGSTDGAPYVEYDQTVAAGGGVVFLLEYYDATRQPFVSTNFVTTAVAAVTPPVPVGTVLQLDRIAFISQGQLTIEFATNPGHTYVVEYSASLESPQWKAAVPPIVANATKTQWIDSGPPKTDSPPGPLGQRFYRVVQTN